MGGPGSGRKKGSKNKKETIIDISTGKRINSKGLISASSIGKAKARSDAKYIRQVNKSEKQRNANIVLGRKNKLIKVGNKWGIKKDN